MCGGRRHACFLCDCGDVGGWGPEEPTTREIFRWIDRSINTDLRVWVVQSSIEVSTAAGHLDDTLLNGAVGFEVVGALAHAYVCTDLIIHSLDLHVKRLSNACQPTRGWRQSSI